MSDATTYMNVTLYIRGMMGSIKKIECRKLSIEIVKFAQYSNAVSIEWLAKGQRREREEIETYRPTALVLDGWGHPDPDGIWDESTRKTEGTVTMVHGRYRSCDPRWQGDFDAKIGAYIAEGRGKILADYRNHVVV